MSTGAGFAGVRNVVRTWQPSQPAVVNNGSPRVIEIWSLKSRGGGANADMNAANHALYAKSGAVTELLPMKGRSHFTLGEPGWEEVADQAIAWVEGRLGIEPAG